MAFGMDGKAAQLIYDETDDFETSLAKLQRHFDEKRDRTQDEKGKAE